MSPLKRFPSASQTRVARALLVRFGLGFGVPSTGRSALMLREDGREILRRVGEGVMLEERSDEADLLDSDAVTGKCFRFVAD